MEVLTTVKGQSGLPRYFLAAHAVASKLGEGRLDFIVPDGRRFRIEGDRPGIAAEISIHNPDLFARMLREGDLGFSDAYLDGWWSSPDLQAFLDLIQRPANLVANDGYPGLGLLRRYERFRFWLQSNSRAGAAEHRASL